MATNLAYSIDQPQHGAIFCHTCKVTFVYVPGKVEQGISLHEKQNPYKHPKELAR